MRMRLQSYREVPPNGYRYTVPETGYQCNSWDVKDWVSKTKSHLKANGIPIPIDLQEQMEDQLCTILPSGYCEYDDPSKPHVNTEFTWGAVETGSKTFLDWASQGRPLVAQDEAERRAKICANCYLNVRAGGCGAGCRALIRQLFGLFINRKTAEDDRLQSCSACKCFLRAKVHFGLDIIEAHDTDSLQSLLPNFCWLKKGGDNYKS